MPRGRSSASSSGWFAETCTNQLSLAAFEYRVDRPGDPIHERSVEHAGLKARAGGVEHRIPEVNREAFPGRTVLESHRDREGHRGIESAEG